MPRRTISLSEKDIEKLEQLVDHFDALSINDAIRRAISQASAVSKHAAKDGSVTVEDENGEKLKIKVD
ncbi:MAG: ribbon-helix-helix protein, CopG family [Pseudomonadota bacterium]